MQIFLKRAGLLLVTLILGAMMGGSISAKFFLSTFYQHVATDVIRDTSLINNNSIQKIKEQLTERVIENRMLLQSNQNPWFADDHLLKLISKATNEQN